jgi:DNA-binding beta-propeller fold protein YncE
MPLSLPSKRAGRTRRAFLLRAAGLGVLALPLVGRAAPAPVETVKPGGFLVLDNCDPVYDGKARYEDNLSFFDSRGKLLARVSGLNNCEEIGSPHKIAVDSKRRCVWVVENVGNRLLQYDLKGKLLRAIPSVKASAAAVDPDTGNVWALWSTGRIGGRGTRVFDPNGKLLATYSFDGWDIAHDPKGKAFWLAGQDLVKVSLAGKVLLRKRVAGWCSSSLAVNRKTGDVWVATRQHSPGLGDDALLGFDNAGRQRHAIGLAGRCPFRVAVDSASGVVCVTLFRGKVLRYTAAGKADGEHKVAALAADAEEGTGAVWVATNDEVLKLGKTGKVLARARHKGKTSQAWVSAW